MKNNKYELFPQSYLNNWIKNDNPLTGFIPTKKVKGFIPSTENFNKELFLIDTSKWSFENSDILKERLVELMDEFEKMVDIKAINKFFKETGTSIEDNLKAIKDRHENVNKIAEKYNKKAGFNSSLSKYMIYMLFSNVNFSTCYYFNEKRSKKVERIAPHNQRFLLKNQILLLSFLLDKKEKDIITLLKKVFTDNFDVASAKKEISFFNSQIEKFSTIFSDKNEYEIKFEVMNPMFMLPLFNVPVGSEITQDLPFFYLQASPLFMLTLVSKTPDKNVKNKKEQPVPLIVMNDIVTRRNPFTEAYYYRGAMMNFFKMFKSDKIDEWFNKKDYSVFVRIDANGKEGLVTLSKDFEAKFNATGFGSKQNPTGKPNSTVRKTADSKSNKIKGDDLTSSLDDIYK